ncbi:MAG: DUF2889 domain-containing protein [Gammaproteobacteria bacterium]|nr:DUF2889 domain-containing protein [Gammaproteobacteria bacterium]
MSLPLEVKREKQHHRRIDCTGYLREDGLWDIEAHLTDVRSYDCGYDPSHRNGLIKAGEAVHDMRLLLTVDLDFVIHEAHASSDLTPFSICPQAVAEMRSLVGIQMGAGWMKQVRERIGARDSCTHLMDLLGQISATAYQTLHAALEKRDAQQASRDKPPILDTCIALSTGGEVVKKRWPEFYTGPSTNQTEE